MCAQHHVDTILLEIFTQGVHEVALHILKLMVYFSHKALLAITGHPRNCGSSAHILLAQIVTLLCPEMLKHLHHWLRCYI